MKMNSYCNDVLSLPYVSISGLSYVSICSLCYVSIFSLCYVSILSLCYVWFLVCVMCSFFVCVMCSSSASESPLRGSVGSLPSLLACLGGHVRKKSCLNYPVNSMAVCKEKKHKLK